MKKFLTSAALWAVPTMATIPISFYIYHFYKIPLSKDLTAWGQFGDYIGGTLNPLVAFSALLWLITSVRIQKQELSETRVALEESQKAQRDQADTSLLAAQISTLNIELLRVASQLQHIREKQLRLTDLLNRPDHPPIFVDEHSRPVPIATAAANFSEAALLLMSAEEKILQQIKDKSSKFKPEVYASYSSRP